MAVILALAGVLMVASEASAQGLFRADDLQVYDSTGKQVGTLSSTEAFPVNGMNSVEVAFRTGSGRTLLIDVSGERLIGTSGLYFPEPDCTGQPFVSSSRMPATALDGPRRTVYVQSGRHTPRRMRAVIQDDGRCVETVFHSSVEFAPARRLAIDLADYFTPPFVLRATAGEAIPTGPVVDALAPTDRIVVFDSTGKKVAAAAVYAVVTGSGVTIPMVGMDWRVHRLYFESMDCTGTPFLGSVYGDDLVGTSAVGPRKAVYLRTERPARRNMYSSSAFAGGECVRERPINGPGGRRANFTTGAFAPAAPVGVDLADYFTPPFSARAGRGTRSLPAAN